MKIRPFVSFNLVFSFVAMTLTGFVLFIVPQGRIAYWCNWKLFGLGKDRYGELHTAFMVLFVFFGLIHIFLNWKAIFGYLRTRTRLVCFLKKEFIAALLLNIFFFVGSLYYLEPFNTYFNFYEDVKEYWAKDLGEPPYGHAEESTLIKFTRKIGVDLNNATKALKKKDIVFNKNQKLKDIAESNDKSPKEIYEIIINKNN
jgi:hypothetical protein